MQSIKKKAMGISRNRISNLKAAKQDLLKRKNRFKIAGRKQSQINIQDDSLKQLQGISSTRQSSTHQSQADYNRSLQIYDQAKFNLNEVFELKKKIAIQCKARMTCFKQTDTNNFDQKICKLSSQAVKKILAAEKNLSDIRKFRGSTDVEQKYFRNMQKSLSSDIRQASKSLRAQQKQYFDRLRTYGNYSTNKDLQLTETQKQKMKDTFQNSQMNLELEKTEDEQRNKQLTELVKSINQLTTVYKQLNQLVIQQGSIIDRIDVNIQETFYSCQKANKHLKGAQEKASSPFAQKCMIALLGCILIIAIILGFKYASKSSS